MRGSISPRQIHYYGIIGHLGIPQRPEDVFLVNVAKDGKAGNSGLFAEQGGMLIEIAVEQRHAVAMG